ncbi:MAG: flagellar basal-body MS-ring/collar protein FliF [Leptospirillia bacterium]
MIERLVTNFGDIPLGQRLILLMCAAASVATIVVAVMWAQKPQMEPLFGSLSVADANAVVDQLRDKKVPYELGAGGTAVLVPSSRVHELRMAMAESGIPAGGGVGFEIFDRTDYGTTDYVQKVNYRRALEGELGRTISAMDQVASARVHLVLPEKRLFSKDQEEARASVTLKLRGHNTMDGDKVAAIVHLVGSAVAGLNPEQVTVVDLSGKVLYAGQKDRGENQIVSSQEGVRHQLEERLSQRVADILGPVVGMNAVQVQVAAELDFTRTETTKELFDPGVQAVRSEQRSKEQSEGTAGSGGTTGVTAAQTDVSESNKSKSQNETINYELNKTVSHTVSPVGEIKRMTVAVVVDSARKVAEDGKVTYTPRTDEEMAKYIALVKKAVGFDSERGDSVEVVNIPFATPDILVGVEEPGMLEKLQPYAGPAARYLLALATIGAVIGLILRPLAQVATTGGGGGGGLSSSVQGMAMPSGLPKTIGQLEAETASLFDADFESDALVPSSREEVLKMAQDNPKQTAEMLKSWIKEG